MLSETNRPGIVTSPLVPVVNVAAPFTEMASPAGVMDEQVARLGSEEL